MIKGTKEWSEHSFNIARGCSNGCVYCYAAANNIRFGKKTSDNRREIELLDLDTLDYRKRKGVIMFPTAHDITTPELTERAVKACTMLLDNGNRLLIVTKGEEMAVMVLVAALSLYKDSVEFRISIGSLDNRILKRFEPYAPPAEIRIRSLLCAERAGYRTSVSMEPYLDDWYSIVIATVRSLCTEGIWIGKMNHPRSRIRMNTDRTFNEEYIDEIIELQKDERIMHLYEKYRNDGEVHFKDSIMDVVRKYPQGYEHD